MLLGVRYGGCIASSVAMESEKVNSLILWEPVTDTSEYVNSLRTMHRQMTDLWTCKINTVNDTDNEEILGSLYSQKLLADIENQQLDLSAIDQPQFIIDLYDRRGEYDVNEMQRFMPAEDEDSWSNLQLLETSWLRSQTSRQITLMAAEMFYRLTKFKELGPVVGSTHPAAPIELQSSDSASVTVSPLAAN